MAEAAKKSAATTTLAIEQVEFPVALFAAVAGPATEQKFDTAGPNGGKLKYETRGAAAPEPEPGPDADPGPESKGDPLGTGVPAAEDPGPEPVLADVVERATAAGMVTSPDAVPGARVDGEFRQVLVEDGTGDVVAPDDVRKGVRLDNGTFIDCTDQLEAITERTKLDKMQVVAFIDAGQVPRHRVTASYYLGSDEPDARVALRVLADAMRDKRRAAVVRWSARSRQSLGVIVPFRRTAGEVSLLVLKLAWAEDFREAPPRAQLAGVAVNGGMVEQAGLLIDALSDTRESMDELRDEALSLREELKARALAGEVQVQVVKPLTPESTLGDQLAASLAGAQRG